VDTLKDPDETTDEESEINSAADANNDGSYFRGCNVYMETGFSVETLSHLRKIVLTGGGTRLSEFGRMVTHYICSESRITPQ
jgi:hypothetical protein